MKTAFPDRERPPFIVVEADDYAKNYAPYFEKGRTIASPQNTPYISKEETAVERLGVRIGTACIEVFMGRRPLHHLSPWMTAGCYRTLSQNLSQAQPAIAQKLRDYPRIEPNRAPALIRPRRVIVQKVADYAYEISLLVTDGCRTRAVALRAERKRGQWKIVTLLIA